MSDLKSVISDRILLNEDASENFIKSIKMRYETAVKLMGIDTKNLHDIYCNSINKHTCVVSKGTTDYLIFDEHHANILSALNLIYHTYGQIDLKFPYYKIILDRSKHFTNRIKSTLLILLSEKEILNNRMDYALYYAKEIQKYPLTYDEKDSPILNIYLNKLPKLDTSQVFSMNFYVFHELAHIKYKQDIRTFIKLDVIFNEFISTMMPSLKEIRKHYKTVINNTECICDIYALQMLIEYVSLNEYEDFTFDIVESYIISTINIVLMDSVYESKTYTYDEIYISMYLRIILVINTLLLATNQTKDKIEAVQNKMLFVRERYENYKTVFDSIKNDLKIQKSTSIKTCDFMSNEWNECFDETLNILSKLK